MKKYLITFLFICLLLCSCKGSNIQIWETAAPSESGITAPDIMTETRSADIAATGSHTTTMKEPQIISTSATTSTSVSKSADQEGNEIDRREKGCYLTLRCPLSEEELSQLFGVTSIGVSLSASVDLSELVRLEPLRSLRIECAPTDESFELTGVNELFRADIKEIYICGGGRLLDLSGVRNDKASRICLQEVVLRSDLSTSFPFLDQFDAMGVKFENEAPFFPFMAAKKVYIRACILDDINTISEFSMVEKLTLFDGDISKLNVLQDFPYLSEIALFGSPPNICSIDALKDLPSIETIHYGHTCFAEKEEALLKEWYPDCELHVLYGL